MLPILSGWMENQLKNICYKDSIIRRFFVEWNPSGDFIFKKG